MIVHYVSPAHTDREVMRDQFEYLMDHPSYCARPNCLECSRLKELAITLKWPFRAASLKSTAYQQRKVKHA
jgi:hypothetical protein